MGYADAAAIPYGKRTIMTSEDDRIRNETLDQLYDLAPNVSRGWWCGARNDPGRAPCIRIVKQLIKEGLMSATIGDDEWVVSAQLTLNGRRDVDARRATFSHP